MAIARFESPYEAIFVGRFGQGNKPLFENQNELAAAIIAHPKSEYKSRKEVTVRSAVSQIFTGERNLSKNLRWILLSVVEKRFNKKKYDYEKFEKSLIEKFRSNYEERLASKRNGLGDIDYKSLIDASKSAKQLLITTLEPAELHASGLADRLKDELLQKTGIIPSEDPLLELGTYKFYLPNRMDGVVAIEFWKKLRTYASEEHNLPMSEVNDRLLHANSGPAPRISTYLVDEKLALYPFIFLDYAQPKIIGFCVSYKDQEPSVAELSPDVVHTWKKLILPDLERTAIVFQFKQLL